MTVMCLAPSEQSDIRFYMNIIQADAAAAELLVILLICYVGSTYLIS